MPEIGISLLVSSLHPSTHPGCGDPVVATPVVATPVVATPVVATPVVATPVVATPVVATPVVARSPDPATQSPILLRCGRVSRPDHPIPHSPNHPITQSPILHLL